MRLCMPETQNSSLYCYNYLFKFISIAAHILFMIFINLNKL